MTDGERPSISLRRRGDGAAVVLFDTPESKVNVLSLSLAREVEPILGEIESDASIRAFVVASAKDSFIAGADLKRVLTLPGAEAGSAFSRGGQALFDRIARCPKPSVAAIHGAALGGGLELAMACTYRLATDDEKTELAQPEVQLGLLPAAGGTQRLPRLVGLPTALPMLLTGRKLRARQALKAGLVDAVTSPGGLLETACRAALSLADGSLRRSERREPPLEAVLGGFAPFRTLVLRKAQREVLAKTHGHYPAPLFVLECVEEGLSKGTAAGLAKEAELFGRLVADERTRNLIRLFLAMTESKKLPDRATPRKVTRVGVLGAGLMGEGIASVSLGKSRVVVKDVSDAALAKAAGSLARSLDKRVKTGALSRLERDRRWNRLRLTTNVSEVAGCDLVVEAVFEEIELKKRVLRETEAVLADDAVYASNTSALPIASIAEAAKRPERCVGMHYFSPVPKMPLLEVVAPANAAPWAVETAKAYGVAQGKTVVVVKDGPGFYTTRILAPYLNEAILLLEARAAVDEIDRALVDFGFPVGPLTLLDEVGIDVGAHVAKDLGAAFASRGLASPASLGTLVAAGVTGRKSGRGFYLYPKDERRKRRKEVDPAVYAYFGGAARKAAPEAEIVDRTVLAMVNEAAHALGEGIVASASDADLAAILGLGFPPFRGGPFRFVDAVGVSAVVRKLETLAKTHGPRFTPAPVLSASAASGARFHEAETGD